MWRLIETSFSRRNQQPSTTIQSFTCISRRVPTAKEIHIMCTVSITWSLTGSSHQPQLWAILFTKEQAVLSQDTTGKCTTNFLHNENSSRLVDFSTGSISLSPIHISYQLASKMRKPGVTWWSNDGVTSQPAQLLQCSHTQYDGHMNPYQLEQQGPSPRCN